MTLRRKSIRVLIFEILSMGAILYFPLLPAYSMLRTLGLPSLLYPIFIYFIVAAATFLSGLMLLSKDRTSLKFTAKIITMILIYVVLIILLGALKYSTNSNTKSIYMGTLQTGVFYSVLCFLIGLNYENIISVMQENKSLRLLGKFSVFLMIGILIYSMLKNYRLYGEFQIADANHYLIIGDGVSVTLLFLFCFVKKPIPRMLAFIFFFILILGTSARGCLLSYIAAVICFSIIKMQLKPSKIIKSLVAAFLFMLMINYIIDNPVKLIQIFGESRGVSIIIGLLFDWKHFLYNDPSVVGRLEMLQLGLQDLKNVWFFGSFMRDIDIGIGYIHNWLSFWSNYGLIPFVLFVFIYIKSFMKCIFDYNEQNDVNADIVILVSFYTLFQILFFRAYVYATVWFSLAALVNFPKSGDIKRNYIKEYVK